ncbi:MAG: SH3 domain-containing protein [Acetivibrionales bacterium]
MKKAFYYIIAHILVLSILFSGCNRINNGDDMNLPDKKADTIEDDFHGKKTDDSALTPHPSEEPGDTQLNIEPNHSLGNIKVIVDTLNIREDKTINSKIINKAQKNDVFRVLDKGLDSDNKTWYLVEYDFGAEGWIAGWFCEKTDKKASAYKSEKGCLLNPKLDEDLYVRTLRMEEYTKESFEECFGSDYTIRPDGPWRRYEYQSGLFFVLNKDNEFIRYGFSSEYDYILQDSIIRKTCDIFSDPGDELLIFYEYGEYGFGLYYRLLVCNADTKDVLREYNIGNFRLYHYEFGDFMNDGSLQMYLDGYANGILKKGIYKAVDDDFVEVFNYGSFDVYKDKIISKLDKDTFTCSIRIDGYNQDFTSVLPDKVFYDTIDVKDKNELLSLDSKWNIIKKNDKWFILLRYSVNYPMIYYYWGPLGDGFEPNETMDNDLARIDITMSLKGNEPELVDVHAEVKYNNPLLLDIEPLEHDEIRLVDGPVVDDINIAVNTQDYETPRGLRVGDSIEKVESLYGKPDNGFSGDDCVYYKCSGDGYVNYYRGIDICYKDNVVESFTLYQLILD